MRKIINFLLSSLLLVSCEVKVNGIQFKENGLKVEQAFLLFEDGKLVPSNNKVDLGQWVGLRLIVAGWQKKEEKVYVDAEEQITTSDGKQLLDQRNLFKGYANGLSSEDSRPLTLSARIIAIDKWYDFFTVTFRVWDKQNQDEISGSYKLYLE